MMEQELSSLTEDQLRALLNDIQSEIAARDKQRKDEATTIYPCASSSGATLTALIKTSGFLTLLISFSYEGRDDILLADHF